VGLLTAKTRWVRLVNTLTSQEQLLEVNGGELAQCVMYVFKIQEV